MDAGHASPDCEFEDFATRSAGAVMPVQPPADPAKVRKIHTAVERFDADGIDIFAPESTNPPTPGGLKKHLSGRSNSDSRLSTIIIMRATLHQGASNTYYGQWPTEKAAVCCIESHSIAHNGVVARAEFADFEARA